MARGEDNLGCEVSAGDLASALSKVAAVARSSDIIPILRSVLLEATEGCLRVTANDLDKCITIEIPAETATPFARAVEARRLAQLVGALDRKVALHLARDGNVVTAQSGRSRYRFASLPEADFPKFPFDASAASKIVFPAEKLCEAIARTEFAALRSQGRYYLQGLHIHRDNDGRLTFVTTDGDRLARFRWPVDFGAPARLPPTIQATDTVKVILALAKQHDGSVDVEITETKSKWVFGNITLLAKSIDGVFPQYERLVIERLPAGEAGLATIHSAALGQAAKRISLIGSQTSKIAQLAWSQGEARLAFRDPAHGEAVESIPCEWSGEPRSNNFDLAYIVEQCEAAQGDVQIAFSDDFGPTKWTPVATETPWTGVLMPCR